ncbi:MAG: sporulation protein YqfD [Clostridiales bacterium]|nr:sporulation protein YqfD [Candidatus Equinaster intestinalis]
MFFLNFYRYLFGFVEITVRGEFPERILNLMAKNGIVPWNIEHKKGFLQMCVRNCDFKKLRKIRAKCGVKIHICKKKGINLKLRRFKLRYGFVAGFILFIAIQFFLSSFVWQIEICGNNTVNERDILPVCEKLGIKRGALKRKLDMQSLREKFILSLPKTAWASLNLEGSRITVNISEIKNDGIVTPPSNIVSDYDCVIKDILVTSGIGMVKKGQAVQKGELLIGGANDIGADTKFVTAAGEITAEIEKKYKFYEDFITDKKVYWNEPKTKNVLEFFSLKIPLYLGEWKGNADTEKTEDFLYFLGAKSPILLHKKTYRFYEIHKYKRSENELEKILEDRFSEAIKEEKITDYELISHNLSETDKGIKAEYEIKFVKKIGISENLLF